MSSKAMPTGPHTTRRAFCAGAASVLLPCGPWRWQASAQIAPTDMKASSRPDVAAIDHDRILNAARLYLQQQPTPLPSLPCPRSPGTPRDYYSEAEPSADAVQPVAPFTAHRDAVFAVGLQVPALAAAYLLTTDERYAQHAALHLRAWFIDPHTRMTPRLDYAHVSPPPAAQDSTTAGHPAKSACGSFEGILETVPLVEVAQAIPFLAASPAVSDSDRGALHTWFAEYLQWLTAPEDTGPRLAALARDSKDHHGSSWLLQASAYSLFTVPEGPTPRSEDSKLAELRHRFRTVTLRAQITADGAFHHELTTNFPYRNSLMNLDLLAAVCDLLNTRFENVWEYQLEDGPGMRAAIAYHFPYIADRTKWPFRADPANFDELPGRRPGLLFCARAYQRPEYAELWKTLPPDPPPPEILRSIPLHQPLLWVRQPPRAT